ncbi:MAG: ATP-binding protein [Firmicutes bacterium]|nr:ATP-binding protein [Bacillota bacterium]
MSRSEKINPIGQSISGIFDVINLGIIVINATGHVAYANHACEEILNVSFANIKDKHYSKAFAQIPPDERFTLITLETGKEFKNIGYSKARFNNRYVTTNTVLLKDDCGKVIGAAGIFKDVTHIYDLQKDLQESSKLSMLGNVAAGMAHEILNPITTTRGLVQVLKQKSGENKLTPDMVQEFSDIMLSELESICNLINNFIYIVSFKPINMQPVDLNKLVEKAVELIASRLKEKVVKLRLSLEPDIKTMGDKRSLRQALTHLMDNAVEFLPVGGQISITTGQKNDRVYIVVADNGVGMSEEVLDAVFTPFFSTCESKKGLGLSIAQRIIRSHNGQITAKSRPGEGACFTITLPAAAT